MKRRHKILFYIFLLVATLGGCALIALLYGIPQLIEKQLPSFVTANTITVEAWQQQIRLTNLRITGGLQCPETTLITLDQLTLQVNPREVLITGVELNGLTFYMPQIKACGWPREPENLPAGDDVVAWHNLAINLRNGAIFFDKDGKARLSNLSGSMQLTRKENAFAVRDIQLAVTDSFRGQHFFSGTGLIPRYDHLDQLKTELSVQSHYADLAASAISLKLPVKVLRGSANIRTNIIIDQKLLKATIHLIVQNLELKNLRQTPLFSIDPVTMLPLIEDLPGVHILNVRIQGKLDDPKFDPIKKIQQEFTQALRKKIHRRVTRLKNTLNSFRNLIPLP